MSANKKISFWNGVFWITLISFFLIGYIFPQVVEEGSIGAKISFLIVIIDIVLFVVSIVQGKKAKAESLNISVEEYDRIAREELEKNRKIIEEAKKPKIDSEGKVVCPNCGSTNIQIVKRGWKVTTGFIGSGKNERVCVNCMKKF